MHVFWLWKHCLISIYLILIHIGDAIDRTSGTGCADDRRHERTVDVMDVRGDVVGRDCG
jgi:hypothetical protein